MQLNNSTIKNIIALVVLGLVFGLGYYLFFFNSTTSSLLLNTNDPLNTTLVAQAQSFVQKRQTIQSLTLDVSLLQDQNFLSLQSYSRPIQIVTIGRSNPFVADVFVEVEDPIEQSEE